MVGVQRTAISIIFRTYNKYNMFDINYLLELVGVTSIVNVWVIGCFLLISDFILSKLSATSAMISTFSSNYQYAVLNVHALFLISVTLT
jgi:hypothetical protein